MKKRVFTGLLALAFVCTSLLLMTSCAKKQVQVSEGAAKSAEVCVPPVDDATLKAQEAENAAYRAKQEAERQKMARDMQARSDLKTAMRHFKAEKIYFDFDKAELKPESREILKKKASWLMANPGFSVVIAGNCDERGTNEYNMALGERRAMAAFKFLNALGVSGDRMETVSYGEEKPVDAGHTPEAWAKNRRDDFDLKK